LLNVTLLNCKLLAVEDFAAVDFNVICNDKSVIFIHGRGLK